MILQIIILQIMIIMIIMIMIITMMIMIIMIIMIGHGGRAPRAGDGAVPRRQRGVAYTAIKCTIHDSCRYSILYCTILYYDMIMI